MLDMGKQTGQFFESHPDHYGHKKYRLKTLEQYAREHNANEQPGKQYFKATTLPEIVKQAPMPSFKGSRQHSQQAEIEKGTSFLFIWGNSFSTHVCRDEQPHGFHRLRARPP